MRNIVVTGATKGIGRAIVEKFAQNGFNVAFCARNNQQLKELASHLESKYGVNTYYEQCNVADKSDLLMFADHVKEEMGTIDILVNNAGMFVPGQISEEEDGVLEKMMDTNLFSAYRLTRAFLPEMLNQNAGHIVNLCSTASIKAYPNGGSYCISKFALLGMTKVLREELKNTSIKVTAVLPGPTYSASWEGAGLPEERFMKSAEVADTIFLACNMPGNAVMEEIVMRPQLGDI